MKSSKDERGLCLTEEEAMGLLDIVMMTNTDMNADQHTAILKLSEFCREFLRERASAGRGCAAPAPCDDSHHPACAA